MKEHADASPCATIDRGPARVRVREVQREKEREGRGLVTWRAASAAKLERRGITFRAMAAPTTP